MTTLQELLQRREELERRIAESQNQERTEAIETVRRLMAEHGLSVAKYRNPATGESWSGRGLQPRWLKAALAEGRQLSDFSISEAA